MTSPRFIIADVFTDVPFGGNQLGVFPDATGLDATTMQAFARELNFAESTFVFPPDRPEASYRVRIFTPTMEVPFAGHPNVGTAAVLAKEGMLRFKDGRAAFVFDEGIGPVRGAVIIEGERITSRIVFDQAVEERPATLGAADAARLLGLEPGDIVEVFSAGAGIRFTFVRIRTSAAVDRATLDLGTWRSLVASSWGPQVYLFAGDTAPASHLYVRMFAPAFGITEDPATGSGSVALAGVLCNRLESDGAYFWVIDQGVAMGRPSRLELAAIRRGGKTAEIELGGSTTIVGSGSFLLPGRSAGG